jgi:hypothetical protein
MAAECVPRLFVIFRYIIQGHLTLFIFDATGTQVRIGGGVSMIVYPNIQHICTGVKEAIGDIGTELTLLNLHSEMQRCRTLETVCVVDVAAFMF